MKIGVTRMGEFFSATVWAPRAERVAFVVVGEHSRSFDLEKDKRGYWHGKLPSIRAGEEYMFQLDGEKMRPDPASFFQREGVHGPSQVIDHDLFPWEDSSWRAGPLDEIFFYELHVGTFTQEGDFDSAIRQLDRLKKIGINAIEVMPVSQFPGARNWGYDGVYPFSVQNSYGGPEAFKRFVNHAHKMGISVYLDVVYNHLGPEGNYLRDFGPYFTSKYETPWGESINYDGPYSDEVRNYFIENAIYWIKHFHVDGLRLDAIHGIFDMSAFTFLEELRERVDSFCAETGKKINLIAESDLNDVRVVQERESGGYGLDGAWCDDFHHALHALLTGERVGYYKDFGRLEHLEKAFTHGYVYSGQYSEYRKHRHGSSSRDLPGSKFVVFAQNHDQVGNRMQGERLSKLCSFSALKLAAACVMFSPYLPLIFMGEEFAAKDPFKYFISHGDTRLVEAVREGRKNEFRSFEWTGEVPDPQCMETFNSSKLNWEDKGETSIAMEALYKEMFFLRKIMLRENALKKNNIEGISDEEKKVLKLKMNGNSKIYYFFANFGPQSVDLEFDEEKAEKIFDTSSQKWSGSNSLSREAAENGTTNKITSISAALFEIRK